MKQPIQPGGRQFGKQMFNAPGIMDGNFLILYLAWKVKRWCELYLLAIGDRNQAAWDDMTEIIEACRRGRDGNVDWFRSVGVHETPYIRAQVIGCSNNFVQSWLHDLVPFCRSLPGRPALKRRTFHTMERPEMNAITKWEQSRNRATPRKCTTHHSLPNQYINLARLLVQSSVDFCWMTLGTRCRGWLYRSLVRTLLRHKIKIRHSPWRWDKSAGTKTAAFDPWLKFARCDAVSCARVEQARQCNLPRLRQEWPPRSSTSRAFRWLWTFCALIATNRAYGFE